MKLRYYPEYWLLRFIQLSLKLLGLGFARFIAKPLSWFIYRFVPLRKGVVINNLKAAFPEYDDKRIGEIVRGNYHSFILTLLETLYLPYYTEEELVNIMDLPEKGLIQEKYDLGKGVIMLTGHFGNWELGGAHLNRKLGIPISTLAKRQSNPLVNDLINDTRLFWGNSVIPLGVSVKEVFRALRNGELVGLVSDQRGPKSGIRVRYFGQDTAVFTGMAALALKLKSPVVMVFFARQEDYSFKTYVKALETDSLEGNAEEKTKKILQIYFNHLEEIVRRYPEQWFWMHNIWKY